MMSPEATEVNTNYIVTNYWPTALREFPFTVALSR